MKEQPYLTEHAGQAATGVKPLTAIKAGDAHEWRLAYWDWRVGDPWTWELHYLPVDDGTAVRCADEYEAALLDECKRLVDAAHGVSSPQTGEQS